MNITVRDAESRDLAFVGQDGYLDPPLVTRKIDQGEVFVAELDGEPAGYVRIEYLWSVQPYIALIRVEEPRPRWTSPSRRPGTGTWASWSAASSTV